MEHIEPDNLSQRLTAFADGELDAAGNLAVLRHVAAHPEALAAVQEQQQLRLVARRAVRGGTPPVGDDLRRRIEAMAASPAGPTEPLRLTAPLRSRRTWGASTGWLAAAAAVALLLSGGVIGRMTGDRPAVNVQPTPGGLIPASLARSVTFTHVDCSRMPADAHAASVVEIKPDLVAPLELDLHRDAPYPDLSSIGYRFVGAGPCAHPVEDAVHLLYRSTDPGVQNTLSVFVRPYRADDETAPKMEPGRLYEVAGQSDPHPLLAWRTGRLVYFLVGNNMEPVERARDVIQAEIRL